MTLKPIAITGASGFLGGHIAVKLAEAEKPLRLVVRNKNRAPDLDNAQVAVADYFDFDAMSAALAGVRRLFFVSGNILKNRLESHKIVIDAAVAAGVEHVVYTSFLGAGPDAIFTLSSDHWQTETYLAEQGMSYTAMRNSFYAEIAEEMVDGGTIKGPGGNGMLAPVSRHDVADTASGILISPAPPSGPVEVTGPEALSLHDIAQIYSDVTGRPAKYVEETIEQAYASLACGPKLCGVRHSPYGARVRVRPTQVAWTNRTSCRFCRITPLEYEIAIV